MNDKLTLNTLILLLDIGKEKKLELAASKLQAELDKAKLVSMEKDQRISNLKEELKETQEKLAAHREESTEHKEPKGR